MEEFRFVFGSEHGTSSLGMPRLWVRKMANEIRQSAQHNPGLTIEGAIGWMVQQLSDEQFHVVWTQEKAEKTCFAVMILLFRLKRTRLHSATRAGLAVHLLREGEEIGKLVFLPLTAPEVAEINDDIDRSEGQADTLVATVPVGATVH